MPHPYKDETMAQEWLLKILTTNEERQRLSLEKLRELEAEFIKKILQEEEPMIM